MGNWKVEWTAGGETLVKVKVQKGIFQVNLHSLQLWWCYSIILGKCTAGYKCTKSQEKINHLMYMDDIKIFAKNKNEQETQILTVRIRSLDTGIKFGIEKRAMLIMKSGEKKGNKGMNRIAKSRKHSNA